MSLGCGMQDLFIVVCTLFTAGFSLVVWFSVVVAPGSPAVVCRPWSACVLQLKHVGSAVLQHMRS